MSVRIMAFGHGANLGGSDAPTPSYTQPPASPSSISPDSRCLQYLQGHLLRDYKHKVTAPTLWAVLFSSPPVSARTHATCQQLVDSVPGEIRICTPALDADSTTTASSHHGPRPAVITEDAPGSIAGTSMPLDRLMLVADDDRIPAHDRTDHFNHFPEIERLGTCEVEHAGSVRLNRLAEANRKIFNPDGIYQDTARPSMRIACPSATMRTRRLIRNRSPPGP